MPSTHPNKVRDLSFGNISENKLLPYFRKKYGEEIAKSEYRYSFFDYSDSKTLIELKTRRIRHNQYPTALCNLNKIQKLYNDERNAYLIFSYLDGLFEVPIKENYKKWKTKTNTRCDRGKNETSTVCHIPYSEMIAI